MGHGISKELYMPASKFASEVKMMEPLVEHFRGNVRDLRQNLN